MNTRHITIRPGTDADLEAITRIFDMANPAWATSRARWLRLAAGATTPANGIVLVAEDDGRIVGIARANEALEGLLPQPGTFSARVAVDPGAAGQGIGGRLWDALANWINTHSPKQIASWCDRDDQRSVAIAARWGFTRRPGSVETPEDLDTNEPWAWDYELRLDLPGNSERNILPVAPGVTVSSLPEMLNDVNLVASLHEVHEECRADVPAWEPYEPKPRSRFIDAQQERLENGGLGLVAHREGEVLAATFAERAAFVPLLHNDFTMVRRSARGHRLALAVKSRLVGQAVSSGIDRITTEVRTDNEPMLAVNRTLGFRRIAMRQLSLTPVPEQG